jgi:anionic cell wall polymer biosynthesis LytR-Cps2A-Psr (LCP) family protein
VTVDVPERIVDNAYPTEDYGYQRVVFEPGVQTLDGERALEYARTRHADSDFGRMRRQQQIIFGLRQQLLRPGALAAVPEIVRACWNTSTDLSISELVALGNASRGIDGSRIVATTLDENDVQPYTTRQGAEVLLPNWPRVHARVASVFAPVTASLASR